MLHLRVEAQLTRQQEPMRTEGLPRLLPWVGPAGDHWRAKEPMRLARLPWWLLKLALLQTRSRWLIR